MNRRFAELCGWKHDPEYVRLFQENLRMMGMPEDTPMPVPDFAADPRLVLREMMKREDCLEFLKYIGGEDSEHGVRVPVLYVLDTTGLLRDRAIDFMEMGRR